MNEQSQSAGPDQGTPLLTEEEYDRLARSACFVCRIVEGNPLLPNPRIIYEDEQVIAFLNHLPTQEGYAIVCPCPPDTPFEKQQFAAMRDQIYVSGKRMDELAEAIREKLRYTSTN